LLLFTKLLEWLGLVAVPRVVVATGRIAKIASRVIRRHIPVRGVSISRRVDVVVRTILSVVIPSLIGPSCIHIRAAAIIIARVRTLLRSGRGLLLLLWLRLG
jgi:hypothetical protein